MTYDDGDAEVLDLLKEKYELLASRVTKREQQQADASIRSTIATEMPAPGNPASAVVDKGLADDMTGLEDDIMSLDHASDNDDDDFDVAASEAVSADGSDAESIDVCDSDDEDVDTSTKAVVASKKGGRAVGGTKGSGKRKAPTAVATPVSDKAVKRLKASPEQGSPSENAACNGGSVWTQKRLPDAAAVTPISGVAPARVGAGERGLLPPVAAGSNASTGTVLLEQAVTPRPVRRPLASSLSGATPPSCVSAASVRTPASALLPSRR